jgi:uncharacterized membrane protein YraQ (UPF0718 family)
MEFVAAKLLAGVTTTLGFFWDSLYGLIFGFLISAIAQTVASRGAMERALGPGARGVANGTIFGIVASACSYGAAAAARGFYQKGADVRAVFAFMISSTNMNVAIVIMFWAMLGWQFAFAEFFGGLIIIAIVCAGATLLLRGDLQCAADGAQSGARAARVTECLQCGMEGEDEHAVAYEGTTYLFCGARHEGQFRADPAAVLAAANAESEAVRGFSALRDASTWKDVLDALLADVEMLRSELIIGFTIAGFAAALVPSVWLSSALRTVQSVPFAGYPLVLLAGLLIAIATFVCSMGNVPIARFLANAGIPLGANTTFIYGDLLIPPLLGIYRKSFAPKVVWTFVGLFTLGAMIAGAIMDAIFGRSGMTHAMAMGSETVLDRFTIAANVAALVALAAVVAIARSRGGARGAPSSAMHS